MLTFNEKLQEAESQPFCPIDAGMLQGLKIWGDELYVGAKYLGRGKQ